MGAKGEFAGPKQLGLTDMCQGPGMTNEDEMISGLE